MGRLTEFMNNLSLNEYRPPDVQPFTKNSYNVKDIPIEDIVPNEKNFYIVDNVELLEESIEADGLKQPLEVFDIGNGAYKLLGGHRRYKAISNIRQRDISKFTVVPCLITIIRDELDEKLQLVNSNATSREMTDYEKMRQMQTLKEIYAEMKRCGYPITGRQRELIAEELNVSTGVVHEMENIASNATEEVKKLYKNEEVSTHLASEVAKEPESIQKEFAASPEKTATTLKEIKDQQMSEIKHKKKEKTDNDYGNTAILRSDVEEIANLSMELADEFEEEHIIISGKPGKDIEKKLRVVKKKLEALMGLLKVYFTKTNNVSNLTQPFNVSGGDKNERNQ